ncbi:unnamed protein product [Paramecium octaurelia]|uniref:LITAF domain-containing protein n=1 Tax=Paramecium octaurelia TaxID=43137 RepID=A0A8S1UKC0_PAROT|nr:unnamed protein product [Paramecium octaurelia]
MQPNNYQNQNDVFPPYPQQYPNQYPPQVPMQQQQPYIDNNIYVGQPVSQQQQFGNQQYLQQPYIIQQPVEISTPIYASAEGMRFPIQIKCQFCQQVGITRIQNRIGDGTICASILVLLLCWPLFWLPCCLEDCQDRIHLCQSCGKVVGKKKYEVC